MLVRHPVVGRIPRHPQYLPCDACCTTPALPQIESKLEDAVELVEVLNPIGVSPGRCSYLGPHVDLTGTRH